MREEIKRTMILGRGFWKHAGALFVLWVLCWALYNQSLHNDFMIDDHGMVLQDTKIHNPKFIFYQFIPDLHKNLNLEGSKGNVYYRPLAHVLPLLGYLSFGSDPFGYHLVNCILFYLCAVALYGFLNLLVKDGSVAFLTTLFFCVHPINALLVNYITASVFSVQILSMTAGLALVVIATDESGPRNVSKGRRGSLYFLSLMLFGISLLCHETAIVFPLYLAACLWFSPPHHDGGGGERPYSFKKVLAVCSPFFIMALLYLWFRLEHASLKYSLWDKIPVLDVSWASYLATFTRLIVWYLEKIFFLGGIVLIWATPVIKNHLFLWNLLFVSGLSFSIWILMKYGRRDIRSFALSWFMIGLLPVTVGCFFQPAVGFMIEPHWLFFSAMGLFLLVAVSLQKILRRFAPPRPAVAGDSRGGQDEPSGSFLKTPRGLIYLGLIFTLLLSLAISTQRYNILWGDERQYCSYWLKQVPGYKSVLFHLAGTYLREGEYAQARRIYKEALENRSSDEEIYINLGLMDEQEGNLMGAMEHYKTALIAQPHSAIAYNNLGIVYLKEDKTAQAQEYFERALALNRFLIEPRLNLVSLDLKEGEYARARTLLEENLAIDPAEKRSLFSLIQIDLAMEEKAQAVDLAKRVLRKSKDPLELTSLGSLFAQHHFSNLAFSFYFKALQIDPSHKNAFLEAGKLYGNLGDLRRAIVFWQEGLRYHPSEKMFGELIAEARRLLEKK